MNYYYVQQGKQTGPVAFESLLNINFNIPTTVWTKGEINWVAVRNKEDLLLKLGATYLAERQRREASGNYANPGTTTTLQLNTASVARRFGGLMIDLLYFIILVAIFSKSEAYVSMLLFLATPLLTYWLWSGSVGHRLLGMKVVFAATGEDFKKPLEGTFREFIKYTLMLFVLPVLWLLIDNKGQNVYDKIYNTKVIKINKP